VLSAAISYYQELTPLWLELAAVRRLIDGWLAKLEVGGFAVNPLAAENAPRLELISG